MAVPIETARDGLRMPASAFASACRNALQVHQVISATSVTMSALRGARTHSGREDLAQRVPARRGAVAAAQRSGSRTNARTTNATPAGIRPNSST